jgi:hypothetical protein
MSQDYTEHTKLTEAKQMRKRADEDARLLANRIALLKQEEQKAQKKIEETRRKAQEILSLRNKNTEMLRQKEEERRKKEDDERMRAEESKQYYNFLRQQRAQRSMSRQNRAVSEANALKNARRQNLETIEKMKTDDLVQKATIRNFIKSQHREAEEKKRRFEREKKEKARMENERKIEEENKMRRVREEEVARMEQEELELIQRLQNTQLLQKTAYEELENALAGPIGLNAGF